MILKAYRNYYIGEKAYFAKWKKGNMPDWFKEGIGPDDDQIFVFEKENYDYEVE